MNKEKKFKFSHQKRVITMSEIKFRSKNYELYETPLDYYIKVYGEHSQVQNVNLANNFIKNSQKLETRIKTIKIFEMIEKDQKYGLLIEKYSANLLTMISKFYFTTVFDIYKFIYQISIFCQHMNSVLLNNFHLDYEKIVLDMNNNFRVTHLDENFSEMKFDYLNKKELAELCLAPEVWQSKRIGKNYSWDLGILLYGILYRLEIPQINYENKQILFNENFENNNESYFLTIKKIIKTCLEWKEENRLDFEKILTIVTTEMSKFNEINIRDLDEYEIAFINKFKDINVKDDEKLNMEIIYALDKINLMKIDKDPKRMIEFLISEKNEINHTLVEQFISLGWKDGKNHEVFYQEILKFLEKKNNSKNPKIQFKTLLILHMYMHKSSKEAYVVFLYNNKKNNLIKMILDKIKLETKDKIEENIIYLYNIYLLRKFEFSFKSLFIIEVDYSLTKTEFMNKWHRYVNFDVIFDLIEIIEMNLGLFLKIKMISENYFLKNTFLLICREFYCLISLLINLLIFLQYLSSFYKFENENEREIFESFMSFTLKLLENHRRVFDIVLNEMKNFDLMELQNYAIKKDLTIAFEEIKQKINLEKLEKKEEIEEKKVVKDFFSKYFNKILVVSETSESKINNEENIENKLSLLVQPPAELVKDISVVHCFILHLITCKLFKLYIYHNLPTVPILINPENLNLKKEIIPLPKKQVSVFEKGIQEDSLKKEFEDLIKIEENLKNDNFVLENELHEEKKENEKLIREIELLKNNNNNNIDKKVEPDNKEERIILNEKSKNTFKKFLLFEFSRNIDEWMINYKDLNILYLIKNASTSQVYKARYRGITVAAKKLKKFEIGNEEKFLKEFKREISILISIPRHPNLINLIGFCLENDDLYIITEFCEGGNLFEVFYELKQKLS